MSRARRQNEFQKHTPLAFDIQQWLRPVLERGGYGSDVTTYTAKRWGELLATGDVYSEFAGRYPGVGAIAVFLVPDLMDDLNRANSRDPQERHRGARALAALTDVQVVTEELGFDWAFDPQVQALYFYEAK